jgi:hypothetical protein
MQYCGFPGLSLRHSISGECMRMSLRFHHAMSQGFMGMWRRQQEERKQRWEQLQQARQERQRVESEQWAQLLAEYDSTRAARGVDARTAVEELQAEGAHASGERRSDSGRSAHTSSQNSNEREWSSRQTHNPSWEWSGLQQGRRNAGEVHWELPRGRQGFEPSRRAPAGEPRTHPSRQAWMGWWERGGQQHSAWWEARRQAHWERYGREMMYSDDDDDDDDDSGLEQASASPRRAAASDPCGLYAELGLPPPWEQAEPPSEEAVRAAFRRLALELHPDQRAAVVGAAAAAAGADDNDNAERFQRVLAAYEVLRDPVRKRRYDRTGVR